MKKTKFTNSRVVLAIVALGVFALTQAAFAANPGVDPQIVQQAVRAGDCVVITKVVHTPPGQDPVRVSAYLNTNCNPNLWFIINPTNQTVMSGDDAVFTERICVRSNAPQCEIMNCVVGWTLNGNQVLLPDGSLDPAYLEAVTILADATPPTIACPANITVCNDTGACSAVVRFVPVATDNCGVVSITSVPPSGSTFPKGTTIITSTATDMAGNTASCTFAVTIIDCEPPVVGCVPAVNPAGNTVPTAGTNPKSGQNPDGFYQLLANDNCDGTTLAIFVKDSAEGPSGGAFSAGPFAPGTRVKLTQSPGKAQVKPMAGAIVAHIQTRGEPVLVVTDSSGNTTCHKCFVPPPPK